MNLQTVRSLYIVSKSPKAGSMLVTLGFTELLLRKGGRLAFFRPLIPDNATGDPDTQTILAHFGLQQSYDDAVGITLGDAEKMLSENRQDLLIKQLLERHAALLEHYDFVLCAGMADEALSQLIDFDLNVELAKNFDAPVIGVVPAAKESEAGLCEALKLWSHTIKKQGATLFMLFANRCDKPLYDRHKAHQDFCPDIGEPVILLPDVKVLDRPNIRQIAKALDAETLIGTEAQMQRLIDEPRIAAMHLEHFLTRVQEHDIVIVPADRSDIILGAMAANYADAFPTISAILLSGDLSPARSIMKLVRSIDAITIPLLHVRHDTMQTASLLRTLPSSIDADSPKKIATALGVFSRNADTEAIAARIAEPAPGILTPAMFEHRLLARAAAALKTIILPETFDDRILHAADILLRRRAVRITLLGDENKIKARGSALGLDLRSAIFVDPHDNALKTELADTYYRLRAHKGITSDAARDALSNPTLFATMMVALGHCDGMVSGATHTTRETILPALQVIKTRPGSTIVSSCFFMCFDTRVLVYADCAVNPSPDAAQLAEIAIASADTARRFGIEPRIAMLSYSTGTSGVGSDVDKVRNATERVRTLRPDLIVDGPMQYDAAIDPGVGQRKMPGSPVAGEATVFIFPDLNTGNNTYKAVQRSAGAIAIGPVLQGLKRPVNDLSRGASVADIVNTVAITAIQAQEESE